MKKRILAIMMTAAMIGTMAVPCYAEGDAEAKNFDGVTISLLSRSAQTPRGILDQICDIAEEKFGFEIEVEITEEDNVVKTRLATGDCPDILLYNVGSQLASLNPSQYFYDWKDTEVAKTFDDAFSMAATIDGAFYGIPQGDCMAAGVYYNKEMYEKYNLEVPTTWDQFIGNLTTLQEAGVTGISSSLKDVVYSQLPFLGDNYQVLHDEPDFAEKFTAGEVKFAESEAGRRTWEKYEELVPFLNVDCASITGDEAAEQLFTEKSAHVINFSNAVSGWNDLYGEDINKMGFFALPGDTEEQTGLTVWPSAAFFANKDSENLEAVKAFLEWYVSDEGLDALCSLYTPAGGFHNGYQPKCESLDIIKEVQSYFVDGKTAPALEFITPIKGADCPQICSELASGQSTAEEAAKAYDEDCKKMAMQLGLWK